MHIWPVSSIVTKSRLGDIEIISEDNLITIKNDGKVTNIYIRKDIAMAMQFKVDLEILEYFDSLLNDANNAKLITLLLKEPIVQLPSILERYNIEIPDNTNNGDTGNQLSDDEDQEGVGEDQGSTDDDQTATAYSVSDSDREEMIESGDESQLIELATEFGNLRISSAPCGNDTNSIDPASLPRLVPQHEVIPSHDPTIQGTIQRPTAFHAEETAVARTSRSTAQSCGILE